METERPMIRFAKEDLEALKRLYPDKDTSAIIREIVCEKLESAGLPAHSRSIQRGGVRELPKPRNIKRKKGKS
jgi:hypothetical protein